MDKIGLLRKASGEYWVHEKHGSSTDEGIEIRDTLLQMKDEGLIKIHDRSLGITTYSITSYGEEILSESDI